MPGTQFTEDDGTDPFFPDAEVRDRHGGHDPGSIGKLERAGGKVGLDVIDRQHGELAFGLERVEAHTNSKANSRAETIRVVL
jgi:hypothetical protein